MIVELKKSPNATTTKQPPGMRKVFSHAGVLCESGGTKPIPRLTEARDTTWAAAAGKSENIIHYMV